jgi:hypothetical protein
MISRICELRDRIYDETGGDADISGIAEASGLDIEIVKRLQDGIDLFNKQVTSADGSFLEAAAENMSEAGKKGFYLQWNKAMDGEADPAELSTASLDYLREQAEMRSKVFTENVVRKIKKNHDAPGNIQDYDELISAAAIYAECEGFDESPEFIGLEAAAEAYILRETERGREQNEAIYEAVFSILGSIAMLSISAGLMGLAFGMLLASNTLIVLIPSMLMLLAAVAIIAIEVDVGYSDDRDRRSNVNYA